MDSKMETAPTNGDNEQTIKPEDKDKRYKCELTRAIRENHGHDINDAKWCPFEGGNAYFATVGANQLNVYDCEVRGNFISTLMNYRNWHLPTMRTKHLVWKENLEKHHPVELINKSFNTLCWMKRYRDFWIALADNEKRIHIISMSFSRCIKIITCGATVVELMAHPMFPNILVTIDKENQCHFRNTTHENNRIIYTLEDKITKLAFSPSGNKFVVVLTNGSIREYTQKVEYKNDGDGDGDDDMKDVNAPESETNNAKENEGKKMIINAIHDYKMEKNGKDIGQIMYCGEDKVLLSNKDGEIRYVDLAESGELLHKFKMEGLLVEGKICKFDLNKSNDCVVYGNAQSQINVHDLKLKKTFRRIRGGKNRLKKVFSFANFCANHEQSILMVQGAVVMKFDPLCLVKYYFPSTADFEQQVRDGRKLFPDVRTIKYEL